MDEKEIFFNDEFRFLGYGESDTYGAWVKFNLRDPEQLALFRGQPSGKKLGKRFASVLVEIDDDEKPKRQDRKRSQEAHLMVTTDNYRLYSVPDEPDAHLKDHLLIRSKSELDDDSNLALIDRYNKHVKAFREWVAKL